MNTTDRRKTPETDGANTLFESWQQACGVRPMPARADLAPGDLQRLMPNIQVFEVIGGGERFFARSAGAATHNGYDPTGSFWDEVPFGTERTHVQAALKAVVTNRQPCCTVREISDQNGRQAIEEALLPLSPDGSSVNMILRGVFRREAADADPVG